jgi:hypothetical protein
LNPAILPYARLACCIAEVRPGKTACQANLVAEAGICELGYMPRCSARVVGRAVMDEPGIAHRIRLKRVSQERVWLPARLEAAGLDLYAAREAPGNPGGARG